MMQFHRHSIASLLFAVTAQRVATLLQFNTAVITKNRHLDRCLFKSASFSSYRATNFHTFLQAQTGLILIRIRAKLSPNCHCHLIVIQLSLCHALNRLHK